VGAPAEEACTPTNAASANDAIARDVGGTRRNLGELERRDVGGTRRNLGELERLAMDMVGAADPMEA
jgi:hypothetical protein